MFANDGQGKTDRSISSFIKGGFYLKLAQNIVFLFSSEMRGSTIRLYTDDRFYRKILKYK